MNKMKSKLTLIVAILITASTAEVFGQERVNREKLNFGEKSEILTKATGWSYNSTLGEWIDYNNVISKDKDYKDKYKSLQGRWMMSRISQNFISIQTKAIDYKGETYYALVIEKWDGRYEYPTIKKDWYTFQETVGYIFSSDEYKKLLNIEGLIELKTQYDVSLGSKYQEYENVKFLDLIQTELSRDKSKDPRYYTFPIMKSNEGAIRFYLPSASLYSKYDFEKEYFETDPDNFAKIILK